MAKKSRIAKRTLRFRLTWDDEVEGAQKEIGKRLDEMVTERDYPIPCASHIGSAKFGSMSIERLVS